MATEPTTTVELCGRDLHALKVYYRASAGGIFDRQDRRILQALENALANLEGREPVEITEASA